MTRCDICQIQQQHDQADILFQNDHWIVVLRTDDQEYLGKSVVSAKIHTKTLAELSNSEWNSFSQAVKFLEVSITNAFAPTHFNWQCLMNDGASTGMTHVHWHCTPRYKTPISFAGEKFVDSRWPRSCRRINPKHLDNHQLKEITNKILNG